MSNKKSKKSNNVIKIIAFVIVLIIAIYEYFNNGPIETREKMNYDIVELGEFPDESIVKQEELQIYFFDVGQADSILVVNNNETMLIDAGNNEDGELLAQYIKKLNIDKIDYLIATHAHEDHIGGIDNIIRTFDIGHFYMPYTTEKTTTTKTFTDVIDSVGEKDIKIEKTEIGNSFSIGNAECKVVYVDNSEPENINDQSICIRMTFGEESYLFMGDATKEVEDKMNVEETNVLKVGHHGSDSSSSKKFLEQVMPQIAVIQVGKDNSYGHPKSKIIDRLDSLNINIYRTDELHTILITSDGKENKINTLNTNLDGNIE